MTLANGAQLPTIRALTREGAATTINEYVAGTWGVVLFYRGHW